MPSFVSNAKESNNNIAFKAQPQRNEVNMAKSHTFKKIKPGKPIPVTARELESFMLEHKGKFNSREYDKFERMELTYSPVRDALR